MQYWNKEVDPPQAGSKITLSIAYALKDPEIDEAGGNNVISNVYSHHLQNILHTEEETYIPVGAASFIVS